MKLHTSAWLFLVAGVANAANADRVLKNQNAGPVGPGVGSGSGKGGGSSGKGVGSGSGGGSSGTGSSGSTGGGSGNGDAIGTRPAKPARGKSHCCTEPDKLPADVLARRDADALGHLNESRSNLAVESGSLVITAPTGNAVLASIMAKQQSKGQGAKGQGQGQGNQNGNASFGTAEIASLDELGIDEDDRATDGGGFNPVETDDPPAEFFTGNEPEEGVLLEEGAGWDEDGEVYAQEEEMDVVEDKEMENGQGMGYGTTDSNGAISMEEEEELLSLQEEELLRDDESATRKLLRGGRSDAPKNDENDNIVERNKKRKRRKLQLTEIDTFPIGLFAPLTCNTDADLDDVDCSADLKLFSALVAASGDEPITVPCGECYTFDMIEGATTVLSGLDIRGKLHVPPNHEGTILTPYVFVQGVLEMSDTNPISRDNTSMTIVLTGDASEPTAQEVTFAPHGSNSGIGAFDVGYKPFLVAGGRLDIRGWDNGPEYEGGSLVDKSWTTLLEMAEAPMPSVVLDASAGGEEVPLDPPARLVPFTGVADDQELACPRQVVRYDFDAVNEDIQMVWSGGDGKIVHHHMDENGGNITLNDLDTSWQGFKLDFTEIVQECPLIDQATYLVTLRIKIEVNGTDNNGEPTDCESTGDNCPRLIRKIMRKPGVGDIAETKYIQKGSIGRYGEWFWFSTMWTWKAAHGHLGPDVIGNIFHLEHFPRGSVISMDDFIFELPSSKSFAPPVDSCAQLAINGDAEDNDGNGFSFHPFYSTDTGYYNPLILEETNADSGIVNRFYRNKERRGNGHAQRFYPNTNCFVKGYIYTVSMKARIHSYASADPISYYIQLFGHLPEGGHKYHTVVICDAIGKEDGWVECSAPLLIDDTLAGLTGVEWRWQTDHYHRSPEDASSRAVFDFDDISIAFKSGPAEGLTISGPASNRWGPNSEVHITSTTLSWKDSQVAVIDTVTPSADGTTTTLSFDNPVDAVLSEKETPGMGAELALLTRNIKIEGSTPVEACGTDMFNQADYRGTISVTQSGKPCQKWSDQLPHAHTRTTENYPDSGLGDHNSCRNPNGDSMNRAWCYTTTATTWEYCNVPNCQGGYLQVLHTPDVPQTIEGVEFNNMGQQQARNRFPLQFLYTRDVAGTSISRNTIRNSAHRCIVMDGVSNATIADNVAHDTAGHCFYMGYEAVDNLVVGNLGSKTNEMISWSEQLSGHSDHDRATFFIQNSQNDFIGNVAAGSAGRGFEAALNYKCYGEDDKSQANTIGSTGSMRRRAMGTFRNNKAHSNYWQGIRLHHFEQFFTFRDEVNVPIFENTKAYRNREHGIYTDNVQAAEWRGGSLSDNQYGLVIVYADRITVSDFDIVGSSEIFKEHTVARSLKLCGHDSWHHEGINMMSAVWRLGHNDPNLGLRLRNVNITGFDKEQEWYPKCKSTVPIAFKNNKYDGHFDYVSSAENVNIIDSRGTVMAGCRVAQEIGVKDIVITDLDGSFNPSGSATGGALVSDEPHVTDILGPDACTSIEGCMAYCPDVCLRSFSYKVEQFGTENWKLKITNTATGITMQVPGTIRTINGAYFSDAYTSRRFSSSLPAGNYTAEFIDEDGNPAWPQYAEEYWTKEPDCSGSVSQDSITLLKPDLEPGECDELIRNGGQGDQDGNLTSVEPWIHTLYQPRDVMIGAGLGMEESDAICTSQRMYHWTGPGQNLDSRCLEHVTGEYYEFSAWMKITAKGDPSNIIQDINPNKEWYHNGSPIMTINGRKYRDETKKEHMYTWEDRDKAVLARPYTTEGWNLIHGIVRVPDTTRAFFEIERAPDNMDFIVDNASFTKMNCNPNKLLLNGDLEEGNSKYWDTWGGIVALDLVAGYGGNGTALRASQRPHLSHGPAQIINTDCVNEGDRLAFSGRIKFESGGAPATCNPFTWHDSKVRCSDIWMYTNKAGVRDYKRVALIVSDESEGDDGWYHVHGLWTLNSNQAQADYTKVYFDGIAQTYDVIVDNIQIKHLPQQCVALVENPSFDDGSAYWSTTDRDDNRLKVDLVQGASGGENDFAMRAYGRDHQYRGIHQKLDTRCFVTGEEYAISAKFRMLNATSGEGVDCDVNDQWTSSENCPSVVVYGMNGCATSNGRAYWRFYNTATNWDKNVFNDFSTTFTVNDELASCNDVYVYIHEVNKEFDLVVDDLQISSYQTESPTASPSAGETALLTVGETDSPTISPTTMPTVSTITTCPIDESTPTEISSGPVMLARSSSLCILTKAIDAGGALSNIAPVALSYDGGDWEIAAGNFATSLLYGQDFGDYNDGSHITLPALNHNESEKYYLTSYSHNVSEVDKVARLLETATFGTTAGDLESWAESLTSKEWIQNQMNLPVTSHREFFRHRTNPRLNHPVGIARSNHPCDGLSRWRNFAFTKKDGDRMSVQQFEAVFNNETDTYITIKLNGQVRTTVRSLAFDDNSEYTLEFNREYTMCGLPAEYEDGVFKIKVNETTNECEDLPNPLVHFNPSSVQPLNVLNLPNVSIGTLEHIDELRSHGGEYILVNGLSDDLCDQLNDVTEERDPQVFGKLPDGSWLLFDPRMLLEENKNTPESHIPDGGGLVRSLTGDQTKCANVPRTFLNEDQCSLSDSTMACGSAGTPNLLIELNTDNILEFHNITGQYVYAIDGLPLRDVDNTTQPSPCELGLRSRWEIVDAGDCTPTPMGAETNATLVELLVQKENSDMNPYLRDIYFPISGKSCNSSDADNLVEAEIIIGSQCFRRVHQDHFSVYDFTFWTAENTHPGNMVADMHGHPNPIKKWMDVDDSVILVYPAFADPGHLHLASHPIDRWDTFSPKFSYLGRFGDAVKFVDLPNEIRLDEVAGHFGAETDIIGGNTMVCGSPNEAANDPSLGQVFEVTTGRDTEWNLWRQREYTWMQVGLTAPDQLRQRVAWALSQLLVIARGAIEVQGSHSEAFLTYYDIFTRNAFGNYRDVLREISYSPLMAENLSYLGSKSAAYTWETQDKISFADENFAREIMQLFSTGLVKLNLDGTPVLGVDGKPVLAYTNDEIMSFARVWTGFDYRQGRGNVEETSRSGNRHDPMKIQAGWRDKFPKTDMMGGYLGDGYSLCVDLPDKMFLRKGATYRLLGASHMPELMEDPSAFINDPTLKKFVLESTSNLKKALCNGDDDSTNCQWKNTVTLNETLSCIATECDADTLRVVQVSESIHFEYVRPPCVEQVFYANAKKVIYKERQSDSSCANPLLPYASEACCEGAQDLTAERSPHYLYDQERVLYSTADSRCKAIGLGQCDFNDITGIDSHKKGYHWTTDSCVIQVKVNDIGQVALVYEPESYHILHPHVKNDNRNFFKVYWDGDYPKNDNDVTVGNTCGNNTCESLATGGCLCGTTITESRVFRDMPSSVDEVLSKLTIGAYDHTAYDEGTYEEAITSANNVTAYLSTSTGAFDTKTVFEVTDGYGRLHRFKNTKERVRIQGASAYAFRNAPSFMSVLNTEADERDAHFETEAALDHYFYHDNTAPFIAFRMIQRFTTSNPKPRYVKAVATAFRTGIYDGIGEGKYGDLAATIAAVLLDPEARSINLDADPFKGNLREPLLKMLTLMRGMELELHEGQHVVQMVDLDIKIGQMAHSFPTVFSFMLPEYMTGGRPGDATLVAPETMLMDMPKAVALLNGMFSMVKYGLSRCYGGFGTAWTSCAEGDFSRGSTAHLSFSRPYNGTTTTLEKQAEDVVSELSTILMAGRLGADNKQLIMEAYIATLNDTEATDPAGAALRLAQQLMLTTAEFQTTNLVAMTGAERDEPDPPIASGSVYKSIVYVMFGGGCDSFNMLVPHTCSVENGEPTLYDEYADIRQDIALDRGSLNVLNRTINNQACETFGVHPDLDSVQKMFNDGDLLFFANTGVLTKETDRENYSRDTETQLFAHNWMQNAAQRVDPLKREDGTGILGRMRDALTRKGLSVGAFSISSHSISLIGEPGLAASPMILSGNGVSSFNEQPSSDSMDATIALLNGKTEASSSGVFGEWYSDTLVKSLSHNQLLYDTLADKDTEIVFPTSHLGRQLKMVAKMIDSRNERGTDADVFFLSTGGWDTHSTVLANQVRLFGDVDASFKAFADEMKAKNVWDSVTLIETSDFARTLTQNGNLGSDHAWGGHYIMMGGGVKGGQIAGTYPSIKEGAPLNIGRGRIIPTTSWEAVFLPIAEWAGVNETEFDYICPNRENFPDTHFFPKDDLFEPTPTLSPTMAPTSDPSKSPSTSPTASPVTPEPTTSPTGAPVAATPEPTASPTGAPVVTTSEPTTAATTKAPVVATSEPTTAATTKAPVVATSEPTTAATTKAPVVATSEPTTAATTKAPVVGAPV